MLDDHVIFINEEFVAEHVTAAQLDSLLASGWRHFGTQFFRYNLGINDSEISFVIPLRIRLADFVLSKSQRRTIRRNQDLRARVRPIRITGVSQELFSRHKKRFRHGVPETIFDFLSAEPANSPAEGKEVAVYREGRLVAVSYFDVGANSVSGIYAIFDPRETTRSLGIFTLLKEVEYAQSCGKEFYYLGYCYQSASFYDYKKRFAGTEAFDWSGRWHRYSPAKTAE